MKTEKLTLDDILKLKQSVGKDFVKNFCHTEKRELLGKQLDGLNKLYLDRILKISGPKGGP